MICFKFSHNIRKLFLKLTQLYYFAGGFHCEVCKEYHISSTRKHENFRETRRKNAMDIKS